MKGTEQWRSIWLVETQQFVQEQTTPSKGLDATWQDSEVFTRRWKILPTQARRRTVSRHQAFCETESVIPLQVRGWCWNPRASPLLLNHWFECWCNSWVSGGHCKDLVEQGCQNALAFQSNFCDHWFSFRVHDTDLEDSALPFQILKVHWQNRYSKQPQELKLENRVILTRRCLWNSLLRRTSLNSRY
jgi:hypothetical protein